MRVSTPPVWLMLAGALAMVLEMIAVVGLGDLSLGGA